MVTDYRVKKEPGLVIDPTYGIGAGYRPPAVYDTKTAKDMGFNVPEGWSVEDKAEGISLISPDKWTFKDLVQDDEGNISDYLAIDPEGNEFTKADLDLYAENTDKNGELLPEVGEEAGLYNINEYMNQLTPEQRELAQKTMAGNPAFNLMQMGKQTPGEIGLELLNAATMPFQFMGQAGGGALLAANKLLSEHNPLMPAGLKEKFGGDYFETRDLLAPNKEGYIGNRGMSFAQDLIGSFQQWKDPAEFNIGKFQIEPTKMLLEIIGDPTSFAGLVPAKSFFQVVAKVEAKQLAGKVLTKAEKTILEKAKLIEAEISKSIKESGGLVGERGGLKLPGELPKEPITPKATGEIPTPKTEPATTIKPESGAIKETVESLLSEGKPVPKDMMDEYIKLAKTPDKTPSLGKATAEVEPPVRPPAPPDTPLGNIEGMWSKGREPVPKKVDTYLKGQEYFNDIYFGIRRLQGQLAKKITIEPGGKNDVINLLTRSPGAANAGATRYILAINDIKKIAPRAMADDINTILYANHAKEILAEKGAGRVMAGGFTTQAELDKALAQLETKLGKADFAKASEAAEYVKNLYARELQRMVDEGLVSEELGKILAEKYPWYNPLHYVEEAEILANQGKSVKPFNVISSGLKRLTQEGTAKEAQAPLNILGDQLIKNEVRIAKNQTSRAIAELAMQDKSLGVKKISTIRQVANVGDEAVFRPTYEDIPGTLSFLDDGVRQVYQVPDFIYREANVLSKAISNPVSSLIGSLNGISRAAFTTVSPPFVVSNILNDMLTAFINRGIMPHETGMRLINEMRGLKNDKIMQAFRLAGGYQQRFYGRSAEALAKDVGVASGKVITDSKSFMKKVWEAIPSAGEAGEQAPRTALFKRQLDRTLPNWRRMTVEEIAATPQGRKAAADAVELTINFGRGGYLIKAANPFVIFLNASMEGTKLPFRVLRDNPAARWRLAGVSAGVTGLTAYNLSYPEYMDIPNDRRWGSVVIMLPSKEKYPDGTNVPNYVTIVPRTREWGLFLGSLTYAMEYLYAKDTASFGKFSSTMAPTLSPVSSIPIPEVLAELSEQMANWDFYTSRPIVSQSLENLPAEEQVTPYTSRTIEAGANVLGISPVRAQHFVNGLFGGASQTILSVTDWIANLVAPETPSPEIVALADKYNALPEDEQETFMNKLTASNKRALNNYLTGRKEALPVLGAVWKRIMPGYGGQLESNQYDLEEKVSDLPSYWADTMTPEQMKEVDATFWTKQKKSDANIIQKYGLDTMGMDDYATKQYLKSNPDTEAVLLLWNHRTSITSLEAANKLEALAKEYNIPLDVIPAFGKTDSGKERMPPKTLWDDYFAYYEINKLDEDTGKMVADTAARKEFRRTHPEFEVWGEANLGWSPLTGSSSGGFSGGIHFD